MEIDKLVQRQHDFYRTGRTKDTAFRIASLQKLADTVVQGTKNPQKKCLMITHCNNPAKAESVRQMILEKVQFADSRILDTAGISSMYANDGGIIIAV